MEEELTQELQDILPTIFYTRIKVHNSNKKIDEYFEKTFTKSKEETFLTSSDLGKNIFGLGALHDVIGTELIKNIFDKDFKS